MQAPFDTQTENALILEALERGQELRFRVSSGSMTPTLYPDDIVIVSGELPTLGEIAFAQISKKWVVHRVVSITKQEFILQPDSISAGPPDFVPKNAVHGKILSIEQTPASKARRRRPRNLLKRARHAIRQRVLGRSHPKNQRF